MIHNMTLEQLCALLDVLPMELAFIDADDQVRCWNRTGERGPAWVPAVLGGPVYQCHRSSSAAAVSAVIARLRSGARDVVDRVVTTEKGITRFRWFAVRSETGEYLGTLEMVQYGPEVAPSVHSAGHAGGETPAPMVRYLGKEQTHTGSEESSI